MTPRRLASFCPEVSALEVMDVNRSCPAFLGHLICFLKSPKTPHFLPGHTYMASDHIPRLSFYGKVALAEGAKNLGAEIVLELAAQGASVAICYHSSSTEASAKKLAETLKTACVTCKVALYQAGLTTSAMVDKLFADVLHDFGKLDIVVNTWAI